MSAQPQDKLARLAVIGCGRLSTSRIFPCFPRLPVRLVGVCDLDEAKARENARRYGGEAVFCDARKMLDRVKPDGVVICIGPDAHAALAKDALARGIPVYTEKPPAPSAAEAQAVAEASRKAGTLCMTAFKYRYAPAQVKAREILASPEFGGLAALSLLRACGAYANEAGDPRKSFLLDFCIHPLDQVLFLGGDVDEVSVVSNTPETYAVALRFSSGAAGSLCFTCRGDWSRPLDVCHLFGAQGRHVEIRDQIFLSYFAGKEIKAVHEPRFCTAGSDSLIETGFLLELKAFVDHLLGERPAADIPSRIEESVKALALYEAIARAAASGKREKPERFA